MSVAAAQPLSHDASPARSEDRRDVDAGAGLDRRARSLLFLQRAIGAALAPLWFPAVIGLMRFGLLWKIRDARELRRQYRDLRRDPAPLLIVANHLTLVDSAVIAWALGSPLWYLGHYAALPWNVPERSNFASSLVSRVLVYLMKCLPIERGRDRRAIGRVLARLAYVLVRGEAVLIYPEGGRSRSGRVETGSAAYGVGRLIASVPGCRVLCVYLRGEGQDGWSALPRWRERFRARSRLLLPVSEERGMRRARDLSGQLIVALQELEAEHFADRDASPPLMEQSS